MRQKPKIVLLANDRVGLAIAQYLREQKENIVALVLHPKQNAKLTNEIRRAVQTKNVFDNDQIRNPRYLSMIKALKPDIAICAWFGYILKKEFIDLFTLGCINHHNGYLPYNRGKHPQVWAIYQGTKYGVTIHYIDENIDRGDIIAQKEIKIRITDTAGTLYERSLREAVKLFIATWPKIKQGKIKRVPQNNKISTHHFAKEVDELDVVDLDRTYRAKDLINQLRARSFADRTYAYFLYNGQKIFLKLTLSDKPNF